VALGVAAFVLDVWRLVLFSWRLGMLPWCLVFFRLVLFSWRLGMLPFVRVLFFLARQIAKKRVTLGARPSEA